MISISIIIPVYNQKNYIRQCLDSVLSQTIVDKEVICVDDGSTDGTDIILEQYKKTNENLIIVKQENKGPAAARNLGIAMARGEFVHFMDSDDYYADISVLEHMYNAAIQNNVDICGGTIELLWDGVRQPLKHNYANTAFENNGIIEYRDFQESYYHPRYIFRKDLLERNNIRYPDYKVYEDPPFLVHAMLAAGSFYALKESVYVYRCGHKIRKYTLRNTIDRLKGIKEVLMVAKEHNLTRLMYFCMCEISAIADSILSWAICKQNAEINVLVDEINNLAGGMAVDVQTAVTEYRNAIKMKRSFIEECKRSPQIIIFGAGKMGRKIKNLLEAEGIYNILGFAVSNDAEDYKIGNYNVWHINKYKEYRESALIIMATVKEHYKTEMKSILREADFLNICQTDLKRWCKLVDFMSDENYCYYFR